MKNFDYAAPRSEHEAVSLLTTYGERAEVLAGGTDVIGLMKKMVVTPDVVINIMEIPSLTGVSPTDAGGMRIGATVHLDDLLRHPYLENYPAIAQAIAGMNSLQLQSQGTVGGDLCARPRCWFYRNGHGLLNPSGLAPAEGDNRLHAIFGNSGPARFVSGSRLAPAMIALGAQVRIAGPGEEDEKLVSLADFYRTPRRDGQRETALLPGQLLTHIILPSPHGVASGTYEVRHGEGPDYPLVAASAALQLEGGRVKDAQVVLGQVAPTPWISAEARQALLGRTLDEALAHAAGEAAIVRATPLSGNSYKVHLAKVAVKRAVLKAAGLETGGL